MVIQCADRQPHESIVAVCVQPAKTPDIMMSDRDRAFIDGTILQECNRGELQFKNQRQPAGVTGNVTINLVQIADLIPNARKRRESSGIAFTSPGVASRLCTA
jgi:hypothetical protein